MIPKVILVCIPVYKPSFNILCVRFHIISCFTLAANTSRPAIVPSSVSPIGFTDSSSVSEWTVEFDSIVSLYTIIIIIEGFNLGPDCLHMAVILKMASVCRARQWRGFSV